MLITPITTLIDEIAKWHGVSMVDMLDVLMGPRDFSTPDHPWHRCERGEIPMTSMQHDKVIDRISSLRAEGYTIGLLTNSFMEFRAIIESRIDIALFDVVVARTSSGAMISISSAA